MARCPPYKQEMERSLSSFALLDNLTYSPFFLGPVGKYFVMTRFRMATLTVTLQPAIHYVPFRPSHTPYILIRLVNIAHDF